MDWDGLREYGLREYIYSRLRDLWRDSYGLRDSIDWDRLSLHLVYTILYNLYWVLR